MTPTNHDSEYVTQINNKEVIRLTGWKADALSMFLLLCTLVGLFVVVFETTRWIWQAWNYLT